VPDEARAYSGAVNGALMAGDTDTAEPYAYSVAWLGYGAALLAAALRRQSATLRYASLAILALTVLKVFLVDLRGLTGIYQGLSFIGLGIVLLGTFASKAWNPNGADGLLFGGSAFFMKQLIAVTLASAWAFAFSYGMLWLINLVTPTKVERAAEERGLDFELHGEEAYPMGL